MCRRIHEAKICFHKFIIRVGQRTKLVIEGSWTGLEMIWKRERKALPWPIESIVALESQDATFKTAD